MAETSVSRWPRSGSVSSPAAWLSAQMIRRRTLRPWSSYLTTCAQADAPPWLQTHWMLGQFSPRRSAAIAKYVSFVHEGARLPGVWTQLRGQIYLGSEAFVQRMQARIEKQANLSEIPRAAAGDHATVGAIRRALCARRGDCASVLLGSAYDGSDCAVLQGSLFDGE
jgi:signal transduction histidine kinase